jgi:hypothetical protein
MHAHRWDLHIAPLRFWSSFVPIFVQSVPPAPSKTRHTALYRTHSVVMQCSIRGWGNGHVIRFMSGVSVDSSSGEREKEKAAKVSHLWRLVVTQHFRRKRLLKAPAHHSTPGPGGAGFTLMQQSEQLPTGARHRVACHHACHRACNQWLLGLLH